MNKNLKYSRMYLGLFSVVGLVCSVLFLIIAFILGIDSNTGTYSLTAALTLFFICFALLAGILLIKNYRATGSLLIQLGCLVFIIAVTFALYKFTHIFEGWKAILIPLLIWLPLCAPFAIIIFYIWSWSRTKHL